MPRLRQPAQKDDTPTLDKRHHLCSCREPHINRMLALIAPLYTKRSERACRERSCTVTVSSHNAPRNYYKNPPPLGIWHCHLGPSRAPLCKGMPTPASIHGSAVISALYQRAIVVPACARAPPALRPRASAGGTRDLATVLAATTGHIVFYDTNFSTHQLRPSPRLQLPAARRFDTASTTAKPLPQSSGCDAAPASYMCRVHGPS